MKTILKLKNQLTIKRDELKLKLEQKEIVEYFVWKQLPQNAKSRTAQDKVIAELKMENQTWLQEEQELVQLKNQVTLVSNIYDILFKLLDKYESIAELESIEYTYMTEFDLWKLLD